MTKTETAVLAALQAAAAHCPDERIHILRDAFVNSGGVIDPFKFARLRDLYSVTPEEVGKLILHSAALRGLRPKCDLIA